MATLRAWLGGKKTDLGRPDRDHLNLFDAFERGESAKQQWLAFSAGQPPRTAILTFDYSWRRDRRFISAGLRVRGARKLAPGRPASLGGHLPAHAAHPEPQGA